LNPAGSKRVRRGSSPRVDQPSPGSPPCTERAAVERLRVGEELGLGQSRPGREVRSDPAGARRVECCNGDGVRGLHRGFASLGALLLLLLMLRMLMLMMVGRRRRRRMRRRSGGLLIVSLSLSATLSLYATLCLSMTLSLSPRGLDGGLEAERAAP